MLISAKNQFKGTLIEIKKGEVNCELVIDIGSENKLYSIITLGAFKELGLKLGDEVTAVIKANDVLIAT